MRINVYKEELPEHTREYRLVRKTADTGEEFVGLRVWLKSSPDLHCRTEDDDRSAVTFWFESIDRAYSFVSRLRNAIDRP